ncbi:response regulator transcription factor [Planctomycetota bacterium]
MYKQIALYIDNNHQRHRHLANALRPLGFELHKATDLHTAKKLVKSSRYQIVLVNHDTAGKKIFDFCSFIHSGNPYAIIIAMINRFKINTEARLFDCGASDVVTGRQASIRILIRRIKVHLRYNPNPNLTENTIRLGETIINLESKQAWCNGTIRFMPGLLFDLLKYFLSNPNRTISREELADSAIWSDSICSSAKQGGKTFDVNIGKLRRIIESDPTHPKIIKSVRGAGWKLLARPT